MSGLRRKKVIKVVLTCLVWANRKMGVDREMGKMEKKVCMREQN